MCIWSRRGVSLFVIPLQGISGRTGYTAPVTQHLSVVGIGWILIEVQKVINLCWPAAQVLLLVGAKPLT